MAGAKGMEYLALEYVANCLDWIAYLKGDRRPFSRLLRTDQKRLIRAMLNTLSDQLMDGITAEGDHPGWRAQKEFLCLLYRGKYIAAHELLPALGIYTESPFLGECPQAERILPPE